MFEQRPGLICVLVLFGTNFHLVGIFTPGWSIILSTESSYSISSGLWSDRVCDVHGECETTTFYEQYKTSMAKNPKSSAGITYAAHVGTQVIAVITLICCLVSCVPSLMMYRNRNNKYRLSLLTTCLLLVAESLIWTVIGEKSAVTAASMRQIDDHSTIGFPYSILFTALGSGFTLLAAFVNFTALLIEKQPKSNTETYAAQKIQQPPVHVNVQNYPPPQQQGYVHSY